MSWILLNLRLRQQRWSIVSLGFLRCRRWFHFRAYICFKSHKFISNYIIFKSPSCWSFCRRTYTLVRIIYVSKRKNIKHFYNIVFAWLHWIKVFVLVIQGFLLDIDGCLILPWFEILIVLIQTYKKLVFLEEILQIIVMNFCIHIKVGWIKRLRVFLEFCLFHHTVLFWR